MKEKKKPETKKSHILLFHSYEISRLAKSMGTEVDQWFLAVDGKGEWGMIGKVHRISFSGDENALGSHSGEGCVILQIN